jgi:hypothetical protein
MYTYCIDIYKVLCLFITHYIIRKKQQQNFIVFEIKILLKFKTNLIFNLLTNLLTNILTNRN